MLTKEQRPDCALSNIVHAIACSCDEPGLKAEFSPTFPGIYLYYPSRRQQASKLKAFVDDARANAQEH
jgi:DNA-binding transcriptional LysR family regulator